MLKATLRSFLAHKGRLALSLLAVLLSVAFVAGTLMFTDTIGSTFDRLFRSTSADVSITAHNDVAGRNDQNFSGTVPTVPASLIPQVRQIPGVASVNGRVSMAGIVLTDANNKNIGAIGGAPTIGINWSPGPNSPVDLTSGTAPSGDGQVVVDADTVSKHHLVLGQPLHVIGATGGFPVRLSGIATFNTTNPGATLVFLETATAQRRLLGHEGVFTSIDLTAAKGITHQQLRDRVAPVVGSAYDVKTAEQTAKDAAQTLGAFLSVIKDALLGFAGIAVLVGVSLILNTFSMLVAQRTRELGLMRALGASREQVNRSVLVEAALLGLIGSTLGLFLGVGLALGLIKLIARGGMVLKGSQLAVHWPTIVAAYAVGIIVTTVSAYLPARRASRISPMAALREADTPGRGAPLRVRAVVGLVVLAVATGLLVGAATDKDLGQAGLLLGGGVLLSLVGLIVLGPLLARPVIRLVGGWFPRVFGPVGTLSQRNALRNPRRTSATASALMIGLALVASLSVVGSSMAASFDAQIDKTIGADLIVQNSTGLPFPNEVGDTVQATPGLSLAVRGQGTRGALVAADGTQKKTVVVGTGPGLDQVVRIEMRAGTVAAGTAPGHAMIGSNYADAHGLHLGSPVTILFQSGKAGTLTVGGIDVTDTNPGGLGDEPVVASSTLRQYVPDALDDIVFVNIAPGADKAQVKSALSTALAKDPQVQVRDQTDYKKLVRGQIDLLLNLIYGLLALAIIIAILGVVNTLALSVIERTREIGLLRAIGLGRAQLRRMVRLEAVVIALFGALLGLGLGLGWGLAAQRLLAAKGLQSLAVPWPTIIAVVLGAAVVGLLAALGPALRASRLNVLDAIAHE